jgi:ParB/RepB/Spo0J family partition protein
MQRIFVKREHLILNPAINPRHASDDDVTVLVSIIRDKGFKEALWVRQQQGQPDFYEVINGGRRKRALDVLEWNDDIQCDCFEVDDEAALQMALDSFVAREDLSPADEAVAFYNLGKAGMSVKDIASHYAQPERRVRQRLAIGSLPAPLITALRNGDMDLDTAQAFTLTDSPERQLKVFEKAVKTRSLQEWYIRRALTDTSMAADAMEAAFVGLDAYRAAGGAVDEDLFADNAYLRDAFLVKRLFVEKLDRTVADLKNDGWAWVKVLDEKQCWDDGKYERQAPAAHRVLSAEEKQARDTAIETLAVLEAEYNAFDEVDNDTITDEQAERCGELEDKLIPNQTDLIESYNSTNFTDEQRSSLGVLIMLRHKVEISKGRMKPGEKPARSESNAPSSSATAGDDNQPAPVTTEHAGYSDALEDLLRVAARDATKCGMIAKPALAARMGLAARICAFVGAHCPFNTTRQFVGGQARFAACQNVVRTMFEDATDFASVIATLETFPPETITTIEAVLAASLFNVEALKNTDAQWVINQIDPDMRVEGFAVDAEFLGRLSRDQLLLISADIDPDAPIKKAKKPEMLEAILPRIAASNWLPPQLRTPNYEGPGSEHYNPHPEEPLQQASNDDVITDEELTRPVDQQPEAA